jgi:hypothetical protein
MVSALKKAMADSPNSNSPAVEVVSVGSLLSNCAKLDARSEQIIYCPLTIQLPSAFKFPGKSVYQACQDVQTRRNWVERHLSFKTTVNNCRQGDFWLPIVLTSKGPLYGEVIGEGFLPNSYEQPVDLTDDLRQPLYYLGYQLLESLEAIPGVYLLQFSLQDKNIVFDRLWPFPAAPAIASLNMQQPNLFTCYWRCLTNQPILDLTVVPT